MKRLLVWLVAGAVVVGAGAAGYRHFAGSWSGDNGLYRTAPVRRGAITLAVNSNGTVQPVLSVQVGAFVSGPIEKVAVDFNDKVKAGQILARIDPRTYKWAVAHEQAALAHERADLARVRALLAQAVRNEQRALDLQKKKAMADADMEQAVTDRKSLDAQVQLAEAMIGECEANLATAKTNLEFTEIRSPVDGIIIDRKVDPGQTVAAQFQTPVMFVVAPDLEKKVYVYASVDEADIGLIREAQSRREPVTFTVDAYPKDTFAGKTAQVRLNPTTTQNVVTYTVVVESANPQLKLLPGMTANLTFQIEKRAGLMTVPNAALRFRPKPEEVSAGDRAILDADAGDEGPAAASTGSAAAATAGEKSPGGAPAVGGSPGRDRSRGYVWVLRNGRPAAVEVTTGLSDKTSTELVSGDLADGQEVVVGTRTATAKSFAPPPPPPQR
jgi:HlyD family secretion protein